MDRLGGSIRILHVDEDSDLRRAVKTALEETDDYVVTGASTATAALDRMETDQFDCIVSEYSMGRLDGLELLQKVRAQDPDLPFILFTGAGDEQIASEAITAGVTDYLQKDSQGNQYTVLANRIERVVAEHRATAALHEQEERLSRLISNLPGMVYRCRNEPDWPMTFVSDGARALTGYDPKAIEAGRVNWAREIIAPTDRDRLWTTVQEAIEADEPYEITYQIETNYGERRWVWERGQVIADESGTTILEGFITDITVRKEREQELEDERRFVEHVLNSLEDLFYVVDPAGSFRRWNDRLPEVTGYTDAEIETMNAKEFIDPADAEDLDAAIEQVIETGSTRFEASVRTKDGEAIPFELHGTALRDADGELVGIAGTARDVSAAKAREQTLRQYKTLTESVADPMYVMDPDGTIAMVNDALAEHIGYDRSEIVGQSPATFVADDGVERAESLIEELLTTDREVATFEMKTVDKTGTETHNETKIAVMTDESGTFEGTAGVIRDITERKERERELERYETILQAVGDPVYTLDASGHFTVVNEAMEELSGYSRDELVGEHISKIMTDDDIQTGERLIAELLRDEDRANGTIEMDVLTADGRCIASENHVALLPAEDDSFRGTAGVIRDITARKQREKQLEQFASVVSHDLRSPLNVVQGRVEHVSQTGELDHLEKVAAAADRMERLIEDLLTLAHEGQRAGDPQSVALDVVVEETWTELQPEDARIEVETDRLVQADYDRLRELFDNLFRNALNHGDAETVRVVETESGFAVEDDGTGVPAHKRERIFERGFTTSDAGTGFGLAIVDTIVAAHDWSITVAESVDGGARFEIDT